MLINESAYPERSSNAQLLVAFWTSVRSEEKHVTRHFAVEAREAMFYQAQLFEACICSLGSTLYNYIKSDVMRYVVAEDYSDRKVKLRHRPHDSPGQEADCQFMAVLGSQWETTISPQTRSRLDSA